MISFLGFGFLAVACLGQYIYYCFSSDLTCRQIEETLLNAKLRCAYIASRAEFEV